MRKQVRSVTLEELMLLVKIQEEKDEKNKSINTKLRNYAS